MKKEETVTVRLTVKSKVGLDMLISKRHITTGKNMTLSEAIWYLLQEHNPEIVEEIENLEANRNGEK